MKISPIENFNVKDPARGMFYRDGNGYMCIQRSYDLQMALIKHLFHLGILCIDEKIAENYHWLISFELSKIREEFKLDVYKWINPNTIVEVEKVYFDYVE